MDEKKGWIDQRVNEVKKQLRMWRLKEISKEEIDGLSDRIEIEYQRGNNLL